MIFCVALFAGVPGFVTATMKSDKATVVKASEHTCAEIQDMMEEEGILFIEGWFGGREYVYDGSFCPRNTDPIGAYESSSDQKICFVGFFCSPRQPDNGSN